MMAIPSSPILDTVPVCQGISLCLEFPMVPIFLRVKA